MTAINITDLENAKLDVDHIAAVATSESLTATNRLGAEVRTLAGIDAQAQDLLDSLATARDMPYLPATVFETVAKAMSKGVRGYASLVAGSGGTNGQFDIAFSGGGGAGAAGRFVVAGGSIISIILTNPGAEYTSAPTMSFAASTGLTGASATAVIADNVPAGEIFSVLSEADEKLLEVYRNNAGVAEATGRAYPSADFLLLGYGGSGKVWGVLDDDNDLAISVSDDGAFNIGDEEDVGAVIPGARTATEYLEGRPDGDGYAFGVPDDDGNMALDVLGDGTVEINGEPVPSMTATAAAIRRVFGTTPIAMWGDSMVEGTGTTGGQTTLAQLCALLGIDPTPFTAINEGFGSQTIDKVVARQGGGATMLTISGNRIPASGPVTVTPSIELLSYPTAMEHSTHGYLMGIYGTLTKSSANVYTFTRAVDGDEVICPPASPFVVKWSTRNTERINLDDAINILWVSNDVGTAGMTTWRANFEKLIRKIAPNPRFIIVSPVNQQAYIAGSSQYVAMRAAIDDAKAAYPRNFLDIQALIVEHYDPGVAQDVIDYGNKVPPSSLRVDTIHGNNAYHAVVADGLFNIIRNVQGWL